MSESNTIGGIGRPSGMRSGNMPDNWPGHWPQLCDRDRHYAETVAQIWEFDLPFDVFDPVRRLWPHHREAGDRGRLIAGKSWVQEGNQSIHFPCTTRLTMHYTNENR